MYCKIKVELSVFRAQWMSELAPSTGNKKGLPSRSADLKRKQELAREEKVCQISMNGAAERLLSDRAKRGESRAQLEI
ncbi:UNVERIFIED_CONTAM: hypothetical protein FKN15_028330 [Acipenser sinensis]